MLPPAVGTFENSRSSRELISQPPGAPGADEPVGPTQLRQCGDTRPLIPIAIHECEKSGHHSLLPPPQDRRKIRAQHEHIKNETTHPALTREGGWALGFFAALFAVLGHAIYQAMAPETIRKATLETFVRDAKDDFTRNKNDAALEQACSIMKLQPREVG